MFPAATNRRDALDAALLRPGRLHESVELGMPGTKDREGVLGVYAKRLPLSADIDLPRLCQDDVSGGLTCADLEVGMFSGRGWGDQEELGRVVFTVAIILVRSRYWVRLFFCGRNHTYTYWVHVAVFVCLWAVDPAPSFGEHVQFHRAFFSLK